MGIGFLHDKALLFRCHEIVLVRRWRKAESLDVEYFEAVSGFQFGSSHTLAALGPIR